MTDPSEVKRVLARLANGDAARYPAVAADEDYRTVIDAASDATDSLADAAVFADDDGRERLAEAIDAAAAADDHPAVRRGRRARTALAELRTALAGPDGPKAADDGHVSMRTEMDAESRDR